MTDEQEVFAYLEELRDSGVTNMFGAGPYIEDEFGLDKREARELLSKWMTSQPFDIRVREGKMSKSKLRKIIREQIRSIKEDHSTMELKSNIDQTWTSAEDIANDISQFIKSAQMTGGDELVSMIKDGINKGIDDGEFSSVGNEDFDNMFPGSTPDDIDF